MHSNHSSGHSPGQMQGHVHHAGCSHGQQHQIQPQQYFKQLKQLKQKNVQFYWMQVLKGAVLSNYLQHYGVGFLNNINSHIIQGVVGMVHMMLTFECLPLILRPFISGIFWPLLLYILLNYKIITGFGSQTQDSSTIVNIEQRSANMLLVYLPVIFYVLVALRTSGKINTQDNKKLALKIIQARPYLESPNFQCRGCQIPKAFRSGHCPVCKICVPKFSRHSLVFGVCIGAANELLAILFFLSLSTFAGYCLYKFTMLNQIYGILTKVFVYLLNLSILWMSFTQFCTFLILNIKFGITQYEIQNWVMLQYLMKAPMRQFLNTCNNGVFHNFTQDIFALLGASGFQAELYNDTKQNQERQNQPLRQQIQPASQNSSLGSNLGFPQIKQGTKYLVNWDKAYIVVIPQMPNNPKRKQIQQIMKTEQPKMIANFKLLKKFKKQAKDQNPGFNQFQIQQKAMMKMNEHLLKNPPQGLNMMKPPPQQQKVIQLQMLSHMKQQFKSSQPQIFNLFQDIQAKLKSGQMNTDQAAFAIRMIQQKIMERKMKQIMQAQKLQQQKQKGDVKKQEATSAGSSVNNPIGNNPNQVQALLQAQILQRLEQRTKQMIKQQPKGEVTVQKQQQSQKLKISQQQQELVDDQNL